MTYHIAVCDDEAEQAERLRSIAEAWAEKYGKIKTSGTDHHDPDHQPRGGILTDFPITSEKQLIEVLRSGNYELIKG